MGPEIIVLAQLALGSAGTRVTPAALLAAPERYKGRTVVVTDMPCVDQPRGGFLCLTRIKGRALRIEGSVLGATTSVAVAERMISACKGVSALDKAECRFDVEIAPTTALKIDVDTPQGSAMGALVVSPQIELGRVKR